MATQNSRLYRVAVRSVLRAHFFQPSGPSLPGADWAVSLGTGENGFSILVRTLDRDFPGLADEQIAAHVAKFISDRLIEGWVPGGDPLPHLTMTAADVSQAIPSDRKPWWRFW